MIKYIAFLKVNLSRMKNDIVKIYFDSKEYFENIIADSISLFYGMVHKIKLASVSHFPSDLEVNCLIPNVNAKLVDKFLILDLSLLSDDCSFELVLSSKNCSYSSHFTIYAYKPIKLTDLFGEYCFGKNRLVLNSGLSHIYLHSGIDLKDLSFEIKDFSPYSFFLKTSFADKAIDGINYHFFPSVYYSPKNHGINISLEVTAENDISYDHYYLLGDGDEDGVSSYDIFLKSQ